jgi:hypothetical protein
MRATGYPRQSDSTNVYAKFYILRAAAGSGPLPPTISGSAVRSSGRETIVIRFPADHLGLAIFGHQWKPAWLLIFSWSLAGGCARVIVSDLVQEKLDIVERYSGVAIVNGRKENLAAQVSEITGGWGADLVFEASGSAKAYDGIFDLVRPGGALVLVGMPVDPVNFDVVGAQVKEARIETVFRYANVHARAVELIASGKVDLKPLVSATFPFEESVEAVKRAASGRLGDVKLQIKVQHASPES